MDDNNVPIIFFGPYSQGLNSLKEIVGESAETDGIEVFEIDELEEYLQLLLNLGPSLTMFSSPRNCALAIRKCHKVIKSKKAKIVLLTRKVIPGRTLDKLMSLGLSDCLVEPIAPKSLLYKTKLYLKSLPTVKESQDDVQRIKSGDYDKNTDSEQENINKTNSGEDSPLLEAVQNKEADQLKKNWEGDVKPGNKNGEAQDDDLAGESSTDKIDKFYKADLDTDSNQNKDGSKTMEYNDTQENEAIKRDKKQIDTLEMEDGPEEEKIDIDNTNQLDSEDIRKSIELEMDEMDDDDVSLNSNSPDEILDDLEATGGTDHLETKIKGSIDHQQERKDAQLKGQLALGGGKKDDGPLQGKLNGNEEEERPVQGKLGEAEPEYGGALEGKTNFNEEQQGSLQGKINESESQDGGPLQEKSSTDKVEQGPLKGKTSTDKVEQGPLKGKTSTDKVEQGPLKGKTSTDKEEQGPLKGRASTDKEEQGPLKGKTSTDKEEQGPLKGKTSTDKEEQGPLKGNANSDKITKGSLKGEIKDNNSAKGSLIGEIKDNSSAKGSLKGKMAPALNIPEDPEDIEAKEASPLELEEELELEVQEALKQHQDIEIKKNYENEISISSSSGKIIDIKQNKQTSKKESNVEVISSRTSMSTSSTGGFTGEESDLIKSEELILEEESFKEEQAASPSSQKPEYEQFSRELPTENHGGVIIDYNQLKEQFEGIKRSNSISSDNEKTTSDVIEKENIPPVIHVDSKGLEFTIKTLSLYQNKDTQEKPILQYIASTIYQEEKGITQFFIFDKKDKLFKNIYNGLLEIENIQLPNEINPLELTEYTELIFDESFANWQTVQVPAWKDETFKSPKNEFIYPIFEEASHIGFSVTHFHHEVNKNAVNKIMVLLESARSIFLEHYYGYSKNSLHEVPNQSLKKKKNGIFKSLFGRKTG
jgi:hypothetical protein